MLNTRRLRVALWLTLAAAVLAGARRLDPLDEGLIGRYFFTLEPTASPVHTTVDAPPSAGRFARVWPPPTPQTFSATWDGALYVSSAGTYTFATVSDDASTVSVDGALVVDNGDAHSPRQKSGTIPLTAGLHNVHLTYDQRGGGYEFQWLWGREHDALQPVPGWRLATTRVGTARFMASAALRSAALVVLWAAIAAWTLSGVALLARGGARVRARLNADAHWPTLRWILLGSLALNAAGIWWGLPGNWPAAEITPKLAAEGQQMAFSHGWHDTYPPFHFYVLTVATEPLRVAQQLGWVDWSDETRDAATLLVFRLVSLFYGTGIVASVWWLGRRAFGPRAGVIAATCFALIAPFVYYAKTANTDTPYIFWFALSMVFYFRILDSLRTRDFLLFALMATLSVCSKDQAYGLYVLMPVPIVWQLRRAHTAAHAAQPTIAAMIDRRLWLAAATSAVAFALCHNLWFNWTGFLAHVNYIVGPGSADYQIFDPTVQGHAALFTLTLWLIQQSMGWPLTLACVGGLVLAFRAQRRRHVAWWLLVPALSYYATFIDVILYNYDRFVLPICLVLAPFAGLFIDRWLAWRGAPRLARSGLAATAFAYTVLYAATVDVLMIRDSRYVVEAWLTPRVRENAIVASTFAGDYLPRLYRFRYMDLGSIEDLEEHRPQFYVLNVDYARAVPADAPTGQLVAGLYAGTVGYRRVFEYRTASPWPWLPGAHHDLTGPRFERRVSTILRNVNPTTAVFEREKTAPGLVK